MYSDPGLGIEIAPAVPSAAVWLALEKSNLLGERKVIRRSPGATSGPAYPSPRTMDANPVEDGLLIFLLRGTNADVSCGENDVRNGMTPEHPYHLTHAWHNPVRIVVPSVVAEGTPARPLVDDDDLASPCAAGCERCSLSGVAGDREPTHKNPIGIVIRPYLQILPPQNSL